MKLKNVLIAVALLIVGAVSLNAYSEDTKPVITEKEITDLMNRGSVDKILAEEYTNGLIEKVVYNGSRSNFNDLINSSKYNMVLFYAYSETGENSQTREAIIFKELAEKYSGKVKFIAYDITIEPDYRFLNTGEYQKIEGFK